MLPAAPSCCVLSRPRLGAANALMGRFAARHRRFLTPRAFTSSSIGPAAAAAASAAPYAPDRHPASDKHQAAAAAAAAAGTPRREHVVVLGTGWAAVSFVRNLDPNKFEVTVISPRNYFTFTPLLPSVCAGTLTPLSCIEPIRGFSRDRNGRRLLNFYEAHATDIDFENKRVSCASRTSSFKVDYDKLVLAVGTDPNTFGVPGVEENCFFLKEVEHAVQIRKRVMANFETAALPTTSQQERERLLHFVVVGGGPTGVETAAEFADFIREDMKRIFPELMPHVAITLVEGGPRLLPTYAPEISSYAQQVLQETLKVRLLLQHQVVAVGEKTLTCKRLSGGSRQQQEQQEQQQQNNEEKVIQQGFVLWASGVGQVPLVRKLLQERLPPPPSSSSSSSSSSRGGLRALPVDEHLRVYGAAGVFAAGDCALLLPRRLAAETDALWTAAGSCDVSLSWLQQQLPRLQQQYPQLNPLKFDLKKEKDEGPLTKQQLQQLLERIDAAYRPPAPTAQNARQAGIYLARKFNLGGGPAFSEEWKGSLAYVGNHNAVAQLPGYIVTGGFFSLPLWKAVYVQMQLTWRIRLICCFDWLRTLFAGRDVGREHSYYK
ncbi:pyridine nucleotide-disulphide oxidoreductase, putative [Eimeria tenella]|uniref:NADH:ubiquinone reductase (non-electrogenic) n=1 Tax=Eimeria tenella TaxID=5802 RepID=U6KTY8_EIMTE|nr:pyridine nucleotide-disulphide oxidoreductase, putative [Eimeria tenella]CDJ40403.1 pyridine nucleotide-disulphide oxidoreductase, putative [Eimeria tenella]|eukprot:XP_013231153.1 pyridine nucleotide-disulphide oxidoreductase, putative [Eimeria tenella]